MAIGLSRPGLPTGSFTFIQTNVTGAAGESTGAALLKKHRRDFSQVPAPFDKAWHIYLVMAVPDFSTPFLSFLFFPTDIINPRGLSSSLRRRPLCRANICLRPFIDDQVIHHTLYQLRPSHHLFRYFIILLA